MSDQVPIDRKLIEIYEEGYNLYDTFDSRQDPTNSENFQV